MEESRTWSSVCWRPTGRKVDGDPSSISLLALPTTRLHCPSPPYRLDQKETMMSTQAQTPVLDTLAAMTAASLERAGHDAHALILQRIAALAAVDARPVSYLLHVGAAVE